jgi:hypothetical protein
MSDQTGSVEPSTGDDDYDDYDGYDSERVKGQFHGKTLR